ncbi:MAG TPA: hypothetical protein VHG30_06575 [Microvirga sp.]|nr:hypothetical protein [Microvirga sp.]
MLIAVAALAGGWSLSVLPAALEATALSPITALVVGGESFKPETLARILARTERTERSGDCFAGALKDVATVRLRAAATALGSGSGKDIAEQLDRARSAVRSLLLCSPHQSYFWYALFWLEMARGGASQDYLPYLEMSYRLGYREGWISPQRSRMALPLLSSFGPELRARVLSEYVGMATYDVPEAANVFYEADATLRATLLPLFAQVPKTQRTEIAGLLNAADVEVEIPGVEKADPQPWRSSDGRRP